LAPTTREKEVAPPPAVFGADRAVRLADGSVVLACPVSKEWLARRAGGLTRAAHPGTAVRWHEDLWEVVEGEPLPAGGIRYRLAPWEARNAIRTIERYDQEGESARAGVRAFRRHAIRRRRFAIVFSPLLGHLPGSVQKAMESEFGAPAAAMTVVSAAPFLVWGVLGLVSFIAEMAGGAPLFAHLPPVPVAAYFTAESALRIGSAMQGDPMGSAAGFLLHAAWSKMGRA
jgi:hypothetical protein